MNLKNTTSPSRVLQLLGSIPHATCQSAVGNHWIVAGIDHVRAQSVLWLFCWAKTGQGSERARLAAVEASNEIFSVPFDRFDKYIAHDWARKYRYSVAMTGSGRKAITSVLDVPRPQTFAVEHKARETFDEEVRNWIDEDAEKNPRSPPHRLRVIGRYAQAFGTRIEDLLDLRYQLLHRTLAASLTARRYGRRRAWMIVQSFAPVSCVEYASNRADFDRYMAIVGKVPVLQSIPVRLAWVDEVPPTSVQRTSASAMTPLPIDARAGSLPRPGAV
jgi:hypothetical protein